MRHSIVVLVLMLFPLAAELSAQQTEAEIRPVPGRNLGRLAIADFVPRTSSSEETRSALSTFNQVLFDDLRFSAFFEIPSKSFYPLRPIRTPQDVDFANWQVPTLDADFLAFGSLQVDITSTVVEAYLYDVKTREQVLGKRYTVGDPELVRQVAHEFADQVVYELSAGASRGVARTQLLFSSLKGDAKEIWVSDYDGANARQLTYIGGIAKFPEWAPDGRRFAFVVKPPAINRWELRIQEFDGPARTHPIPAGYVSSPAFAPDGRLAFSARTDDSFDSDIFITGPDGTGYRNLTRARGIDTSPVWSPTGAQIAFISDRSGTPQVWVMDADGTNVRRLVNEGGHCDSPDWSPDGRYILYSWQAPRQWKHDIYIVEVATGRVNQLTAPGGGSYESPTWSPDGRHITFQSTRTGSKQIFILNADGRGNLRQISAYGINESPSWAPYPPTESLPQPQQ